MTDSARHADQTTHMNDKDESQVTHCDACGMEMGQRYVWYDGDAYHSLGCMEYEMQVKAAKENLGTIVRGKRGEDERLYLSRRERSPDLHDHVTRAAIWVRQDRPEGSSKYKTYLVKALENGRGERSTTADGGYAADYGAACEWIADESSAFDGDPIKWVELPKIVIDIENYDYDWRENPQL